MPMDLRCPFAGWLRVPQASNPRFPVAGWLRTSPSRRPADARCRMARGWPPRRWRRVSSVPTAPGLPSRPRAQGISHCRWLQKALLPVARGPSFAGWLRGFPLCQWLRVSPSPATVPGGEEISTPVRTGRTRGLRQQFQDSLAVHKPSTVNPGLSPGTDVSPPDTPQPGPQGGPAREGGRRVEGPAPGAGGGAASGVGGGAACGAGVAAPACGVGNGPDGRPAGDQPRAG